MNKRMTSQDNGNWDVISTMTGVAAPGEDRVLKSIDRGLSMEEYWMLLAKIDEEGFSPRLTLRYQKIAALMHFFQIGLGKALFMKGEDLDEAKAILLFATPRGRIEALHGVEELERLFAQYEKGDHLFPASVHKVHVPLARSKVAPDIVYLTNEMMNDLVIGAYTA